MVTPERVVVLQSKEAHEPTLYAPVLASVVSTGQRRLEARSYLTDGYGQRQLIESASSGWTAMKDVAEIWQPSRLKGIVVRAGAGLPFLSAGQVFEALPVVRKWLAHGHVPDEAARYVNPEQILMSCSGRVGRITAVYPHHENVVITHDLLRIEPREANLYGWMYAYMRTPQFHGIANASQYGHMIKHLEPEHVQLMPVIIPSTDIIDEASRLVGLVMEKRREAAAIEAAANTEYESLINPGNHPVERKVHGSVSASSLLGARRRLDAEHFRPDYQQVEQLVRTAGTRRVQSLGEVTEKVSLGNRFRRYFGENGTSYRSAEELFDLNAPVTKRVYAGLVDNRDKYTLKAGWIIMACSGQTYGLNGRVLLLTEAHDGIFGSHDLIRIIPQADEIHTGYLLLVLSNPRYGRPMVIRNAYGTSIPHLDPVDVRDVPIPRFDADIECRLGEMMVRVAELKAEADRFENEATQLAESVTSAFMKSHGRI